MAIYTELIDKYLNNELSLEEKTAFEEQLKTNPGLKKEYDLQVSVLKGIRRMGMKNEVKKSFKQTKLTKTILKTTIISLTAVVLIGTAYFIKQKLAKPANHIAYKLNENGTTNWAEADRVLEAQIFKIDPTKDTVIETKGGIIVSTP